MRCAVLCNLLAVVPAGFRGWAAAEVGEARAAVRRQSAALQSAPHAGDSDDDGFFERGSSLSPGQHDPVSAPHRPHSASSHAVVVLNIREGGSLGERFDRTNVMFCYAVIINLKILLLKIDKTKNEISSNETHHFDYEKRTHFSLLSTNFIKLRSPPARELL